MKLPGSYTEWYRCITVGCGIALTPTCIAARIAKLGNPEEAETRRFTELYGEAHASACWAGSSAPGSRRR